MTRDYRGELPGCLSTWGIFLNDEDLVDLLTRKFDAIRSLPYSSEKLRLVELEASLLRRFSFSSPKLQGLKSKLLADLQTIQKSEVL